MEWSDQAIVLSARKHGETSAIVTLMTNTYGVHAGLVRGGAGKRKRGDLQPGNRVEAHWRGRLAEHLGSYVCEVHEAHAALLMDEPDALACLSAALATCESALPEREPHPSIFAGLGILLASLEGEDWPSVYVKWELGLLGELGFGLDFSCCASTGVTENLIYVSPKSGRAVSAEAGKIYKNKMLKLPPFLLREGVSGEPGEIVDGLVLTGYFLERHVFGHLRSKSLPAARHRLLERLRRNI
ncbi:MAG: DNA repair protein RecO [Rhodospirillaceae bacterium]|nr:DNA repair protein RecO [Rhodospirillaceae bacterium]MBL6931012.1 DNA repair protein RecO [Rhodospirillales bacterium]MBL6942320.1 DNA repair protein RecO [Rhodospirillales bacterium]